MLHNSGHERKTGKNATKTNMGNYPGLIIQKVEVDKVKSGITGNFLGWQFSGWQLSGWQSSWGGNFLGWQFSSGGNFPVPI